MIIATVLDAKVTIRALASRVGTSLGSVLALQTRLSSHAQGICFFLRTYQAARSVHLALKGHMRKNVQENHRESAPCVLHVKVAMSVSIVRDF